MLVHHKSIIARLQLKELTPRREELMSARAEVTKKAKEKTFKIIVYV